METRAVRLRRPHGYWSDVLSKMKIGATLEIDRNSSGAIYKAAQKLGKSIRVLQTLPGKAIVHYFADTYPAHEIVLNCREEPTLAEQITIEHVEEPKPAVQLQIVNGGTFEAFEKSFEQTWNEAVKPDPAPSLAARVNPSLRPMRAERRILHVSIDNSLFVNIRDTANERNESIQEMIEGLLQDVFEDRNE